MKKLLGLLFGVMLLGTAAEAEAKVCYKCTEYTPARYVCANKDTFTARRAARKLCNWKSYSSSCNCWKWIRPDKRDFMRYALWSLRSTRR